MNPRIKELFESTNQDDFFLAIELLYRENPNSEYFNHELGVKEFIKIKGYGHRGALPWPLYWMFNNSPIFEEYDLYKVIEYCEERNYFK